MTDWEELVHREGPAVWRTVYRLVRNQADADECFQETFVSAFALSQRQPVKNWPALLQRLATRRAIDRIRNRVRSRRRQEPIDLELAEGREASPSQRSEQADLAASLSWALSQVPAKQSLVFCLFQLDEWSYEQIADHLGMTVNAVGVALHRVREKLKQLLEIRLALAESNQEQG
jgi:RNA polymerase sigma-70 factor (ECF subfamily)